MAIRFIREEGDEVLRKKCREVTVFDKKLYDLLDDMIETMNDAGGVGLAAPQVGILKRVVIIDTSEAGEAEAERAFLELINPVIVYKKGEREVAEGCHSVPGVRGVVKRPERVIVRAYDRNGEQHEYVGEGLLAQAMCHECEHLDGKLFIDHVIPDEEA